METVTTAQGIEVVEFDLQNYLTGGILREDPFIEAMNQIDWSEYSGKNVLVRACGVGPLPPWSFMIVASHLSNFAESIYYGNISDPLLIYRKGTD